jgi:3-deoxy-manno-octulosonate cytidylyltransferase (CMP-KDO synthetase)
MDINAACIIPARYDSTRFKAKAIYKICGIPMVIRVYQNALECGALKKVFVATDDKRIADVCRQYNAEYILTGQCNSGTDRVYEASRELDFDVIVNVQGDEPLITKDAIYDVLAPFENPDVSVSTLKTEIENENDIINPGVVKVITDKNDNAIYFSRYPIPFLRDRQAFVYFRHVGIYAYQKEALKAFYSLPESSLEKAEKLEQLRLLENGIKIKVLKTDYKGIGVDEASDVFKVEELIKSDEK